MKDRNTNPLYPGILASRHPGIPASPRWLRGRRGRLALCSLSLLLMLRLLTLAPPRSAGATSETFFTGPAPCPMAHCNPTSTGAR